MKTINALFAPAALVSNTLRFFTLTGLAVIGGVGLLAYREYNADQKQIEQLTVENARLESVIERLQIEERIAEILVTDQKMIDGKQHTRLLLVERDRNGNPLPPRSFDVIGNQIHVDALVIKFDKELVKNDDPLRGHAILLLEKIYGDAQAPADAQRIDEPGRIPSIYKSAEPSSSKFEQQLWGEFWKLADNESLRKSRGVDVAHGVGVFGNLQPDRKYIITLNPDGNVTRRDEAIPAVYLKAMKDAAELK